jgi:hypothetical protein
VMQRQRRERRRKKEKLQVRPKPLKNRKDVLEKLHTQAQRLGIKTLRADLEAPHAGGESL